MKSLILFILISAAVICFCQFMTADNDWAGIVDTDAYSIIDRGRIILCSTGILWSMPQLNHSRIVYINRDRIWSWGADAIFSTNSILQRVMFSPMLFYGNNHMHLCIKPAIRYRMFNDNIQQISTDISAFSVIYTPHAETSVLFAYREGNIYALLRGTLIQDHYSISCQAAYNHVLCIGIRCKADILDNIRLGCFCDNECRFGAGIAVTCWPYNINYDLLYRHGLGCSHYLSLMLVIPRWHNNASIEILQYRCSSVYMPLHNEPFNINTASLRQISSIKGIGEKMALKIFLRRIILNGYSNYAQIDSISGIGEKTLQTIKQNTYMGEQWKGK